MKEPYTILSNLWLLISSINLSFQVNAQREYKSTADKWLDYDFLMGNPVPKSMELPDHKYQYLLRKLDIAIGLRWCWIMKSSRNHIKNVYYEMQS